jgi:uncharacterized protein (TIGR00251 family)
LRQTGEGVAVTLRVTPKSASARIGGIGEDAQGRCFLRVHVTEAPEKGKANEAVVKLLAKAWRLPRSRIEVVSGESDRNKTVAIKGEPDALMAQLGALLVKDGE